MKRETENMSITPAPARFRLKRKVGYEDNNGVEEEGTLRGVKKLCLDKDVSMDKDA
jgi:hypothetical protein